MASPTRRPTWSYDAAANRTDTVADNLNRPITIGGVSSTSDILGNRLTLGSQTYGWDCLNRMTSYGSSNSYVYRADGMRVSKQVGSTATKYFYDGQMGMEDQDGVSTVTDYGLGARGVDYISRLASGVTTTGFPIYDGHGNMTACLFRSGATYSLGNQRSYDAWGQIRQGAATGDPKGRYCANLGHKNDDESGLVYMRARYYEPLSGRFFSEDPSGDGRNWFSYCANNPVVRHDTSGKWSVDGTDGNQSLWIRGAYAMAFMCILGAAFAETPALKLGLVLAAAAFSGIGLGACNLSAVENLILYSPGLVGCCVAVAANIEACKELPLGNLVGPLMGLQAVTLIAACAFAFSECEMTDPG